MGRQIVVKRISPSPSPSPTSLATTATTSGVTAVPTTTRLIQISGANTATRFVRPIVSQPQQVLIRGQVRTVSANGGNGNAPTLATLPTVPVSGIPGASGPLIVRSAVNQTGVSPLSNQQLVWPSQPLTTNQLQDMFQRPRPPGPPQPQQVRVQGSPIVRTILIPRGGPHQTVVVQQPQQLQQQQQHQQQQSHHQVNTPLPSIQLPSEPVPISPQVW